MSLSACLLTRDEEQTIARAINSVRGVADEVVVVDTGSRDRTAEVAASLGAKTAQLEWDDDFSAGRNFTISLAQGDWLLWLNGTEELMPESHDALRRCIADSGAFGFFTQIHTVTDAQPPARPFGATADLRLFRRRADLRFVGRLHPHFAPELVAAVKDEQLKVSPCDVVLRAYVEAGSPSESKLRWTARLLELELRDRPGQLHYLIEYGRTLLLLKDAKGHEVLGEAAAQLLPMRDAQVAPSHKVQVLLDYLLTAPPGEVKGPISRHQARELALRWFPASPGLLWTVAQQAFGEAHYAGCAQILEQLLRLGRSGAYDRSHRFEPSIVGDQALLNLGACYGKMGKYPEAEACFAQLAGSVGFGHLARQQLDVLRRRRTGHQIPPPAG